MRTLSLVVLCLLCGCSLPAPAAEAPPAPLTVEDAVTLALRNNPLSRAAGSEVRAAQAGVGAARARSNPTLTVTPTVIGPAGADSELLVSQPLEVSGTRSARTGVAKAGLTVARSQAIVATRDLVRDVKRGYYELLRAQETLALQEESVTTAEEFERIARRQVEVGSRPGIDLTQLQVELTRTRGQRLQGESAVHLAAANLNTLMGRPPGTPVSTASRLAFSPDPADTLLTTEAVLDRRAEVAAEQGQLAALKEQARLIRTEGRPDLVLSGRLGSFTHTPRVGGVGLGVSLPLFDYGSRRRRLRQTAALADAQAARVEVTRAQVRLDVESAMTRLQTARELTLQYQQGLLEQAKRLAEAERVRFQTGAGSPLSVLEAQRTYRSVLSDYYGALAAQEQAKAELEWALGSVKPPAAFINPDDTNVLRSEGR